MMSLGPLAFASPLFLSVLAILPAIYWLLKVTPPSPRRQRFPAMALLQGLESAETTPAHTPPWLLWLRMLLAALLVLALAEPRLDPGEKLQGSGPVLLVVDDGWAAAANWDKRVEQALELTERAERDGRAVAILTTAPNPVAPLAVRGLMPPREARSVIRGLEPKPWPVDRAAALAAWQQVEFTGSVNGFWLSDGLAGAGRDVYGPSSGSDDADRDSMADALALMKGIQQTGRLELFTDPPSEMPLVVMSGNSGETVPVFIVRKAYASGPGSPAPGDGGEGEDFALVATGENGRVLAHQSGGFASGETVAEVRLDLPAEMVNRIERVALEKQNHAGAVLLVDERWRRRPVGIVTDKPLDQGQLLLDETFYIDRALSPYAELRRGPVEELLKRELAVLILPDNQPLDDVETDLILNWVRRGGLLIRFAGPLLARETLDPVMARFDPARRLLPVRLRGGDRVLGGAMSWGEAVPLAAFPEASPFAGLPVAREVTVTRQVLAEPSVELSRTVWARLEDGTPLVTGRKENDGWLVLFHSSANTTWNNLPISGLFVEMLRQLVGISRGVAADSGVQPLMPLKHLDAFGRLVRPMAGAGAIRPASFGAVTVSPRFPPGLYGQGENRQALNLSDSLLSRYRALSEVVPDPLAVQGAARRTPDAPEEKLLQPFKAVPDSVLTGYYDRKGEKPLGKWLFLAAFLVAMLDSLLCLWLRGYLGRGLHVVRPVVRAILFLLLASGAVLLPLGVGSPAFAAGESDEEILAATLTTRLAWIETGIAQVDSVSRAGLEGLTMLLTSRTAVEPGPPQAVNPATDSLLFYPFVYWPVDPAVPDLSPAAIRNLNDYVRSGGVLLIDTRDQGRTVPSVPGVAPAGPGQLRLQEISRGLEFPPLEPLNESHVLTRSFYLLQDFPGRYTGSPLWLARSVESLRDGVSPVIITANDMAAAWAMDRNRTPLYPVIPGGGRQREMAWRAGVNIVMYALTGNYKEDQVHVPAILERLGQ